MIVGLVHLENWCTLLHIKSIISGCILSVQHTGTQKKKMLSDPRTKSWTPYVYEVAESESALTISLARNIFPLAQEIDENPGLFFKRNMYNSIFWFETFFFKSSAHSKKKGTPYFFQKCIFRNVFYIYKDIKKSHEYLSSWTKLNFQKEMVPIWEN